MAACEVCKNNETETLELYSIIDRIQQTPHLVRMANTRSPTESLWSNVVNRLIGLVENENNLSALWVWNRFCWTFGRRDTWEASDMLTNIFDWYVKPCTEVTEQYQRTSRWRFLKRRALRKRMVDHAFNLMFAVHQLMVTEQQWSDRAAFNGYAAKEPTLVSEHHQVLRD